MLGLPQHRPDLTSVESIKAVYRTTVALHTGSWLDIEANEFCRQPGTICYTKDEFRQTAHGHDSHSEPLYTLPAVESQDHLQRVLWTRVSDTRNRPLNRNPSRRGDAANRRTEYIQDLSAARRRCPTRIIEKGPRSDDTHARHADGEAECCHRFEEC